MLARQKAGEDRIADSGCGIDLVEWRVKAEFFGFALRDFDGVLVGTSTKSDANDWPAHSDDGAVGRVNGSTQFHDGNSSVLSGFDGTIDEVVVFNAALDGTRIEIHHATGR